MMSFKPTLSLVLLSLLVVISNVDNQVNASLQVQSSRNNIKVHNNLIQRIAQDDQVESESELEQRANDDDDDDDDEEDCDDEEEEEEKKKQEEAEAKKKAQEAKEKKEKAAKAKASSSKAAASKSSAAAKSSKAAKASSKSVASVSHASVASVASVSAASVASVASVASASSAREAFALQQHATPTALGDNVGLASKMQANANGAFNIQPQSLLSVVAAVGLGSLLVL